MKTIAFYLPQFHIIPENNKWWGEGFTEWTNVRKAKPLYPGHYQPRVPLDENYYNLLNVNTIRWQAGLAKEYGIYGFCLYHYWFDGHMLLEKPKELLRDNPDIDINYCICWANEDWTNAWSDEKSSKTLIAQEYGDISLWREHYLYLESFFKDQRYIKVDGKPFFVIYRPELIPCLNEMLDCWDAMARDSGFEGITFAYQQATFAMQKNKDDSRFDFSIEYQPRYGIMDCDMLDSRRSLGRSVIEHLKDAKYSVSLFLEKTVHKTINLSYIRRWQKLKLYSYDDVWASILSRKPVSNKSIPGAFVDWDNSPRKGNFGFACKGANPQKFHTYMLQQIQHAREVYQSDYIFLFAWNEWAEGGYMEPDMKFGFGYLEALRNALIETGEFPFSDAGKRICEACAKTEEISNADKNGGI